MNYKNSVVLKNISYSFFSNIVSMGISAIMIILLPKFLGVADYGIWQLYLFYISYLGIFHFGWLDGIYLRYGGYNFEELNKKKFTSQFLAVLVVETLVSIIGAYLIHNYVQDNILRTLLLFSCLVLVPTNLFTFCSFILQITNNIKQYAYLLLINKMVFFVFVFVYMFFDNSFYGLFWVNTIVTYISLFFGIHMIQGIFIPKFDSIAIIIIESFRNINVGSKLLFANLAGMLMLGIVRFGISQGWDIITFGKISLTLSISNFFMVFINSLSVVLFPMLKRIEEIKQKELYLKIRKVLTLGLFIGMLAYYPLNFILSWWLPKYSDSLVYMAILFPICLYESKVVLLTNTYLKSFRQEAVMMKVNFYTVLLSSVLTYVSTVLLYDLNLMVFSILTLFIFRSILSEVVLGNILNLNLVRCIFYELVLTFIFVFGNYSLNNLFISISLYGIGIVLYMYLNNIRLKDMILSRI